MNAIAPVWDGNETWLVLGGGGLMAAFPLAYAIVLPALYAPLIAMLLGLVFRGVAFEFRWRDPRHRKHLGFRLLPRLAGRDLRAGRDAGRAAAGRSRSKAGLMRGLVGMADPVQLLTGASLRRRLCLARRDLADLEDGGRRPQDAPRRFARRCCRHSWLVVGAVSLATPFLEGQYHQRWFEMAGHLAYRIHAAASAAVAPDRVARNRGAGATGCPSPPRSACSD